MKLISMFEKEGTTFVIDEEGNTYKLVLVSKSIILPSKKYDNTQLRRKIIDMLSELQIPTKYTGYSLLVDCLYFSIQSKEYRTKFSQRLYPTVAERHGISANSVPSNLYTLICGWRTPEREILFRKNWITAKDIILTLTDYFLKNNKMES